MNIGKEGFQMYKYLLLTIICLTGFTTMNAGIMPSSDQGPALYFDHLSRENGLPSNKVLCAIQDFRGYIWIGTTNGLARFDGHDMKIFRSVQGDSNTIPENTVNTLFQASDSLIWIATAAGLCVYDPSNRRLKNFSIALKKLPDFTPGQIYAFLEEKKGSLLLATSNGLIRILGNGRKFEHIPVKVGAHEGDREYYMNSVFSFIAGPAGSNSLLLGTGGGLLRFDTVKKTITRDFLWPKGGTYMISRMLPDGDNKLWVCGWGFGLGLLDTGSGEWKVYSPGSKKITILSIIPKSRDELWLITDEMGLVLFNKTTNRFSLFMNDPFNPKSLSSNLLMNGSYFNDGRDFWVWGANGIDIENKDYFSFRQVRMPYKFWWISDFYKDPATGKLFVGAYNCSGLPVFDTRKGTWEMVSCDFSLPKEGLSVTGFYNDSYGKLWVGTRCNLCYYDPVSHHLKAYTGMDGKRLFLPKDSVVYGLNEDSQRNLWIGTRFYGVIRLDSSRRKIDYFRHIPGDPTSLIEGSHFLSSQTDSLGRIWLASWNGVSIFDPISKTFNNTLMDTLQKYGIMKRWINGMSKDCLGRIWLAIDQAGLVRITPLYGGSFGIKLFNTENGMNDPATGWITKDRFENFWVINAGLLHVDPRQERFRVIDDKNGLRQLPGGSEKMFIDEEDNIFIGDSAGFETRNIRDLSYSEKNRLSLVIEAVDINNRETFEKFTGFDSMKLELGSGQNNINFHFTAICFQPKGKIHYRCMLQGYDREWITEENSRDARYTNLPPGNYRFLLCATEGEGWQSYQGKIIIIIHPFFWQTWWFIMICILFPAALVTIFYRYRMQQLIKMERMRNRIAADLHDDVSSTLSSISILSDLLASSLSDQKSAELVGEISNGARNMLERLDDIIWSVNPKNDKFMNMGLRIREYAIPLFESRNISFTFNYPDELTSLPLPMWIRRNLYLIAKEAINNLVKYSGCNRASVSFRQDSAFLIMEICDNGKGFDPGLRTSRNGILNMRERAQKIRGEFEIRSAPGQGTLIFLRVKK